MIAPPQHVFFIGPRKTGTTTIYDVIRAQGMRTPSSVKETYFFEQPHPDMAQYEGKFGIDPEEPFIEVSPSYFTSDHARKNLVTRFPEAWIVISLRDPVRRSLSALSHVVRIGFIDAAESGSPELLLENSHVQNILRTSNYEPYIEEWVKAFPGRTIVVRQNEQGVLDPDTIERTAQAIGVPLPVEQLLTTRSNIARQSRSLILVKLAKATMRRLDKFGLSGMRRFLKPLSAVLYRPAPSSGANQELKKLMEQRLRSSMDYYNSLPQWSVR